MPLKPLFLSPRYMWCRTLYTTNLKLFSSVKDWYILRCIIPKQCCPHQGFVSVICPCSYRASYTANLQKCLKLLQISLFQSETLFRWAPPRALWSVNNFQRCQQNNFRPADKITSNSKLHYSPAQLLRSLQQRPTPADFMPSVTTARMWVEPVHGLVCFASAICAKKNLTCMEY